jgi:hypothetical protein
MYKWKDELQHLDWYKENPAEEYLSDNGKTFLRDLYMAGLDEADAEAEYIPDAIS